LSTWDHICLSGLIDTCFEKYANYDTISEKEVEQNYQSFLNLNFKKYNFSFLNKHTKRQILNTQKQAQDKMTPPK
jgi:hypothetical protein